MLRVVSLGDIGLEDEQEESILEAIPHVFAGLPSAPGILIFPSRSMFERRADGAFALSPEDEVGLVRSFRKLMGDDSGEGCLILPPGSSPLEAFEQQVVGDKTSFLRKVRDALSFFCQQSDMDEGCPMLVMRIGDFSAMGTAENRDGKLVISASISWFTSREPDKYILSLEDGILEETTGGEEPALSNLNLQDFLALGKKMEDNHPGKHFCFSWYIPVEEGWQPLVISSQVEFLTVGDILEAHENAVENRRIETTGDKTSGDAGGAVSAMPSSPEVFPPSEEAVPSAAPHAAPKLSVQNQEPMPRVGLQPTATRLIIADSRPVEMPFWVGQWVEDITQLDTAMNTIDAYVFMPGGITEKGKSILESSIPGRIFCVVPPKHIKQARRILSTSSAPEGRAMLLAYISSASEVFLAEENADEADGAFIDDMEDVKGSAKIMSRTIETVSRAMGEESIIAVNASKYFWSEDFLVGAIENGVYALALESREAASASAIIAGVERRLTLRALITGGTRIAL